MGIIIIVKALAISLHSGNSTSVPSVHAWSHIPMCACSVRMQRLCMCTCAGKWTRHSRVLVVSGVGEGVVKVRTEQKVFCLCVFHAIKEKHLVGKLLWEMWERDNDSPCVLHEFIKV